MNDTVRYQGKTLDYAEGVRLAGAEYSGMGYDTVTLEFTRWTPEQFVAAGILIERMLCSATKTMVNIADMSDGLVLHCEKKAGHPEKVHRTAGGIEFYGGL